MMLIFAFAPFVEQLRGNPRLSGALGGDHGGGRGRDPQPHALVRPARSFPEVREVRAGPLRWYAFDPASIDLRVGCARGGRGGPGVRVPPRPSAARRDHGRARHRGTIRPEERLRHRQIEVTEPATYEEYRKQVLPVVTKCGASSHGEETSKAKRATGSRSASLSSSSLDGPGGEVLRLTRIRPAHQAAPEGLEGPAGHRRRRIKRKGVSRRPFGPSSSSILYCLAAGLRSGAIDAPLFFL